MDQESIIRLIQHYQTYRFLWDAKDKMYHNRTMREDAWKEISEKMQFSVATLKEKMKILMGTYRSEKSRMNKRRGRGSGSKDVSESKWFAYKYFNFLSNKDIPTETVNTETVESEEPPLGEPSDDTEQRESKRTSFRAPGTSRSQRTGIKRKATEEDVDSKKTNEAQEVIQYSVNSSNDGYFIYALNLANELRKYDQNTLAHVKKAFANILFDADMGMYSASSSYGNGV